MAESRVAVLTGHRIPLAIGRSVPVAGPFTDEIVESAWARSAENRAGERDWAAEDGRAGDSFR